MNSDVTIQETALALRNQFGISEIDFQSGDEQERFLTLKKMLAKRLAEMIDHEFDNFVNALYRIDIDEAKVKKVLAKQPFSHALEEVAEMIIKRQIQKVITRKQYSSSAHDLELDI